jgi:hypothetical protein
VLNEFQRFGAKLLSRLMKENILCSATINEFQCSCMLLRDETACRFKRPIVLCHSLTTEEIILCCIVPSRKKEETRSFCRWVSAL